MIKNQSLEVQERAEHDLLGGWHDKILSERSEFILSSVFCYFFGQCKKVKNVYQEPPITE